MEITTLVLAATSLSERLMSLGSTALNLTFAAIGLGLVIFFHELGHFAVAKWCNVNVERFSIGFGPVLLSWKWGETEYALSLFPFGGYVKMLGQDDADPSQLTSEEIAQDPRSYLAKNVWQRMAIISAGVTMNIITAVFFVGGAFAIGLSTPPATVGEVVPGMPAWKAGLNPNDVIEKINGRDINTFEDVRLNVALSSPPLVIEGHHPDGATFKYTVLPEKTDSHPQIGVAEARSLQVLTDPAKKAPVTLPGTVAAEAEPPFERGDVISAINGEPVGTYRELKQKLATEPGSSIDIDVRREDGSTAKLVVKNNLFRVLGLSMDTGPVDAVQEGSPAAEAGLQEGDKIVSVNGKTVGSEINPLRLPNVFASLHGEDVKVTVTRQPKDGAPAKKELTVRPTNVPGWIDQPNREGDPISIPSIGAAFHTIPEVLAVEPDSPAAEKAEINTGSITKVIKVELILPPDVKDEEKKNPIVIELEDPIKAAKSNNWGYAFWMIQQFPKRNVRLTLKEEQNVRTVELTPRLDPEWSLPVVMGLQMHPLLIERKARTVGEAWSMSANYTRNSAMNIYLTLQSLFTGRVSPKELHGPIGIATAAIYVVQNGLAHLLQFLGFLSINLAVLNFLPIPVLDGGHMVFLTWEAITRRRPSEKVVIGATYAGMAFLLSLMVFVMYLDVFVHPFRK